MFWLKNDCKSSVLVNVFLFAPTARSHRVVFQTPMTRVCVLSNCREQAETNKSSCSSNFEVPGAFPNSCRRQARPGIPFQFDGDFTFSCKSPRCPVPLQENAARPPSPPIPPLAETREPVHPRCGAHCKNFAI